MALTDELRRKYAPLWEKMVEHPFVIELGDGVLPLEKFQRYFVQDYLFLKDASKALAVMVARSPDFEAARRFGRFLQQVLEGEEALFRRVFRGWGLPEERYAGAEPLPTALSYTNYLVRLAYDGAFEELLAALVVAEWTYLDWATRLVERGKRPPQPEYREWIDLHAGPELRDFVSWMRGLLDSRPLDPEARGRVERVFLTTLRLEYLFWEMAYRGEAWPE